MGYHPEVHPDGAPLIGYEGHERPERAHIIIRRRELDSASNDIGFAKTADGSIRRTRLSEYEPGQIGFDQKWLNRIRQFYKEKQDDCRSEASKRYVFKGREVVEDGARREEFSSALRSPIGGAMSQKTITITIDESGNSSIDLDGFADNSCSRVFEDFRGGDKVKTERKKTSFYTSKQTEDQVRPGH